MKMLVKIIGYSVVLAWLQNASAGEVAVTEQDGAVVLEAVGGTEDSAQSTSAPAAVANAAQTQGQPVSSGASSSRVPVKAYYEKIDRANIEKRMTDRAARTRKRSTDAEKDAAERAAKAQVNQAAPMDQGAQQQDQETQGGQ